jgi:hypothetical protein
MKDEAKYVIAVQMDGSWYYVDVLEMKTEKNFKWMWRSTKGITIRYPLSTAYKIYRWICRRINKEYSTYLIQEAESGRENYEYARNGSYSPPPSTVTAKKPGIRAIEI